MRKGFLPFLLLLLPFLVAGCFGDSPSAGGTTETETGTASITGTLTWPDGRPIIGARIRLRPEGYLAGSPETDARKGIIRHDTLTDEDGRFAVHKVRIGKYLVEAIHAEGYGAVARFRVASGIKLLELDPVVLRPVVPVTGRVLYSDSSLAPALVHVQGTEHMAVADSATGLFALPDMPPGAYDLKVSTPMPFFPAKDFAGQVAAGAANVHLGDLVLDRASKQYFDQEGGKVNLAGVDGSNPVLYDNDYCTITRDNEFLWALASLGRLDLRGNLVTGSMSSSDLPNWTREARISRLSGMRNIPEPIPGATRKLARPPGGRWQDIVPQSNPGIQLLLAEARKAKVDKPLIVVAGGPLTSVASALLLDPYIADKMVVFGVYNHDMNGKDSLASYLVARKCRFVEWGRDYLWAGPNPSTAAPLPGNLMGLGMRASLDTTTSGVFFFADFAALPFLVDNQAWKDARGARLLSPPLNASFPANPPFDFIDIPREGNDWAAMDWMFFATLGNPAAYHPWPVPGRIAGVSFQAMSGVAVDSAAGEGDIVRDIGPGDWLEYALEAPGDGDYELILRNHGDTPALVRVSGQDPVALAELELPAGPGWNEASARIRMRMGAQTLRLSTVSGAWRLSRLHVESVP